MMNSKKRASVTRENLERKKMKMKKKKGVMIADDILIDILSRLPGSSLARFRYASKQWLSLSRDPTLINLHLHRARAIVPRHLVALSLHDDGRALVTSLDCTGRRDSDLLLTVEMTGDDDCQMSPSCNGLVCIHTSVAARLLNPTTGELLLLPAPTAAAANFTCLLGFAPATGQYKILRFYQQYRGLSLTACEVLTVGRGNGGWRQIRGGGWGQIRGGGDSGLPLGYYGIPREGATIDGIIYFTKTRGGVVEIVSFNVEDEEFRIDTLPGVRTYRGDMELFESEDRLFLWKYYYDSRAIRICELHQDGCWRHRCFLENVVHSRPLMFHGKDFLLVPLVYMVGLRNGNRLHYHMAWESGKPEEYENRVIMEGKHLLDARTIVQSIVSLATL